MGQGAGKLNWTGHINVPEGQMIMTFSDETEDDATPVIYVGPGSFKTLTVVNRYIAINSVMFNDKRWFTGNLQYTANYSQMKEGVEYILPNDKCLCMAIPSFINVEVRSGPRNDFYRYRNDTSDKFKTHWNGGNRYNERYFLLEKFTRELYQQPCIVNAGCAGWFTNMGGWIPNYGKTCYLQPKRTDEDPVALEICFYSIKITRQDPNPTGYVPNFQK